MKRLAPLLCLVCLAASLPPMPPGYKTPLLSPKDAASKSGATMATAPLVQPPPPQKFVTLEWYCTSGTTTGIVWSSNLVNWVELTNMPVQFTNRAVVALTGPRGFWRAFVR